MPTRTESHKTGDQAASEITLLVNACGWACDTFKSDYGEDLLVQPDLNGRIDHCRIWIQSKGTRDINRFLSKSGDYRFRVPFDHALKWARSTDLVVVVLWDVEHRTGYWTLPLRCIDEWDGYLLGKTKVPMVFPRADVLDLESMKRLGWMARLHHYNLLLTSALRSELVHESLTRREKSKVYRKRSPLIVFDFLQLFGILTSEGVDKDFVTGYRNAVKNISAELAEPGASVEAMAAILAVLARVSDVTSGLALPSDLLQESSRMLVNFIEEEAKAR